MKIIINHSSMQPIYEQITDQIKAMIIDGTLKEEEMLPSVRTLAKELKISALTVKKAYDFLEEEGFVVTVHGKGSFIAKNNQGLLMEERKREIETELEKVIRKARISGLSEEEIRELFDTGKPEEMLEYIQIYATSVESPDEKDKSSQKAWELYQYLEHNREGLLPYDKRGIKIAAPPEGILYKRMGVQENQNCTVITLRMKNRRMRWSVNGANNLAKILYQKENKELIETIERYTDGLVFTMQMQEIVETLSAAKAPKKDGKGNPYVDVVNVHMPLLEAIQTASRKAFKRAFCC